MVLMLCDWILTEFQIKGNKSRYILQPNSHFIATQGSQIRQIWRILRQNCSDDSAEVTEGVTSTPEIFGNKQGGTSTPEGKLRSKFTQWPPSWIWAFQVSGPPQLLRVSLTIVYACQDHVLESLKMAFFFVILDSKYSKMTPKFMKQKSHWLHSSIKFANPGHICLVFINLWPHSFQVCNGVKAYIISYASCYTSIFDECSHSVLITINAIK